MDLFKYRIIRYGLRLLIGAFFLFAGVQKLTRGVPSQLEVTLYARLVAGYPLLHYGTVLFELLCGFFLICGFIPFQAAVATYVFLSLTIGLLTAELTRPHPQPCGCAGPLAAANVADINEVTRSLTLNIGRNVILMVGAAYLIYASSSIPADRPLYLVARDCQILR